MRNDELVRRLRLLTRTQLEVQTLHAALAQLSREERDIIGTMYIEPRRNGADFLCEKLGIERSSVYRRRDKALKKLRTILPDLRDKSGMK